MIRAMVYSGLDYPQHSLVGTNHVGRHMDSCTNEGGDPISYLRTSTCYNVQGMMSEYTVLHSMAGKGLSRKPGYRATQETETCRAENLMGNS